MYLENFALSPTTKFLSRASYDIFGVFGFVGGVMAVFVAIISGIVIPYSQISFEIEAIETLYKIEYKEEFQKINLVQKLRLLFSLMPDKAHLRFLEKGTALLEKEFDLLIIINKIKKL